MKKTTRLIISLCMVALSFFILSFGIWAATNVSYSVSGKVSYNPEDVDMRFKIESKITGASSNPDSVVAVLKNTFKYDNSSNLNLQLDDWNIGNIYFSKLYTNNGSVLTIPDIVIEVKVTNLSSVQPMFVKTVWNAGSTTEFDTAKAPKDSARIRLKFEKQTSGDFVESQDNVFTPLLNKNSSVTYKLTFTLKNNRENITPIAFDWNYVMNAIG